MSRKKQTDKQILLKEKKERKKSIGSRKDRQLFQKETRKKKKNTQPTDKQLLQKDWNVRKSTRKPRQEGYADGKRYGR